MANVQQFCTFSLDGLLFGIALDQVQEVIRHQRMTQVPLAPPVIRGLINLRGEIVTAIDLRRRLGIPDRQDSPPSMNVVVNTSEGPVSLLVDEIGDVLEVSDNAFERPPETLQGGVRALIRGAFKLPERLLLQLDLDEVVNLNCACTY